MSEAKNIEVDEDELKRLTARLYDLCGEMGYDADTYCVLLSMAAKYLCDAQGIEVYAERKMNG